MTLNYSVRIFVATSLLLVSAPLFAQTSDVLEGKAEVIGDAKPLLRVAKESWAKACSDWKNEVKTLNKENQVIALDCGTPVCAPEGVTSVCKSTGTYKIKMIIK